jgi:hypothetical protein
MAVTLGSIAAALLAFAAGSTKSKGHMHAVGAAAAAAATVAAASPPALAYPGHGCRHHRPLPAWPPAHPSCVALCLPRLPAAPCVPRSTMPALPRLTMPALPPACLQVSANLVEIIALVLLPLAVLIVAYSLLVFVWRNSQIAMKQAAYIDDRRWAGGWVPPGCMIPVADGWVGPCSQGAPGQGTSRQGSLGARGLHCRVYCNVVCCNAATATQPLPAHLPPETMHALPVRFASLGCSQGPAAAGGHGDQRALCHFHCQLHRHVGRL